MIKCKILGTRPTSRGPPSRDRLVARPTSRRPISRQAFKLKFLISDRQNYFSGPGNRILNSKLMPDQIRPDFSGSIHTQNGAGHNVVTKRRNRIDTNRNGARPKRRVESCSDSGRCCFDSLRRFSHAPFRSRRLAFAICAVLSQDVCALLASSWSQ